MFVKISKTLQPFCLFSHPIGMKGIFFRGNKKEKLRWLFVLLVGELLILGDQQFEFIPSFWSVFKAFIPNLTYLIA
jgi:hypothetical protein